MCIRDSVSDPLGITAQAVETICRKDENKLRKTCARIEELVAEYEVEKIVLGLPKHMNNDIGDRAEKSMQFGEMIGRRTEMCIRDRYKELAEKEENVIFGGRLGLYRYMDMHHVVDAALQAVREEMK